MFANREHFPLAAGQNPAQNTIHQQHIANRTPAMESSICRFHRCRPMVTRIAISSGRPWVPVVHCTPLQAVDHHMPKMAPGGPTQIPHVAEPDRLGTPRRARPGERRAQHAQADGDDLWSGSLHIPCFRLHPVDGCFEDREQGQNAAHGGRNPPNSARHIAWLPGR